MNWTEGTLLIIGISTLVGFGVCSLAIWAMYNNKKEMKNNGKNKIP